jgi:flagellar biosynthetic protein FliR
MRAELQFDNATLAAFLLLLARLGGMLVFVPVPGARNVADMTRVALVLTLTVALLPVAPRPHVETLTIGWMLTMLAGEALLGLGVGLLVGFLSEALIFGVQAIVLQAGFSYSSAIDPNSQADSTVMQILAQLMANLLFFAAGLDAVVLRAFARSLVVAPPGGPALGWTQAVTVVTFGAAMLELGLRLSLPIAGLLLLTDFTLALVGRLQTQLQLLSLAFPVKMLGTLAALAALAPMMAWIFRAGAARLDGALGAYLR